VGYSGQLAYSNGSWTVGRPTAVPFLLVDVHDSRVATVDYRAADASGGRFHLGYEPRFYFEEPGAGTPVDTRAEAEGFVRWAKEAADADVEPGDVEPLMASPEGAPPADESVELTLEKLLALAGLPPPEWPTDDDAPAG
jgi:hypothetical protein